MKNSNLEKINIIENPIEEQEQLDFDFKVQPFETREDFLRRLNTSINKINKNKETRTEIGEEGLYILKKKDYFEDFNKEEYDSYYQKAFEVLLNHDFQEEDTLNLEKNNKVLQDVEFPTSSRSYNDNMPGSYIKDAHDSIKFFNRTTQNRAFFPRKFKKDSYPYSLSLFEVANINSNEAKEYLKKILDNKKICLFGGGKSMKDLIESDLIKPKLIVNVDPFLDSEEIDRNMKGNYQSLEFRADDVDLAGKIESETTNGQFDEIWASYSVPYYNTEIDQIDNLFNNIDAMLSLGGNCRITPLCVQNNKCSERIMDKLKEMNDSKKYNFDLLGDTLLIHKIKIDKGGKIGALAGHENEEKERIKQLERELGI